MGRIMSAAAVKEKITNAAAEREINLLTAAAAETTDSKENAKKNRLDDDHQCRFFSIPLSPAVLLIRTLPKLRGFYPVFP